MLLTLRKKFICLTVLHTVFVLFASQLTAALPFSMRTSSLKLNRKERKIKEVIFLSPRRVSPFLAWGDFHERSRFARSTIPEENWGTTRSLPRVGPCLSLLPLFDSL